MHALSRRLFSCLTAAALVLAALPSSAAMAFSARAGAATRVSPVHPAGATALAPSLAPALAPAIGLGAAPPLAGLERSLAAPAPALALPPALSAPAAPAAPAAAASVRAAVSVPAAAALSAPLEAPEAPAPAGPGASEAAPRSADADWAAAAGLMDGAASRPAADAAPVPARYGDPDIESLVSRHLPAALGSWRKVGLEIEFYGPARETVMEALRAEFGGTLDRGFIEFDAAVPAKRTTKSVFGLTDHTTDLRMAEEDDGRGRLTFKVAPTGAKERTFTERAAALAYAESSLGVPVSKLIRRIPDEHVLTLVGRAGGRREEMEFEWSKPFFIMRGAGVSRRFDDYESFAAQVESWRTGRERLFHGLTALSGSELGRFIITNEGNGALELVTDPLSAEQRPALRRLLALMKRLGAHDGRHDVGIHVNVTVDKKDQGEMRRLLLAYDAIRRRAREEFRPHANREYWIGAEKEPLIEKLSDAEYKPSLEEFRALMRAQSKGKRSDLNMAHAASLYSRPAAEFRLFNMDLDRVDDMIDFALALTHSAASGAPLPVERLSAAEPPAASPAAAAPRPSSAAAAPRPSSAAAAPRPSSAPRAARRTHAWPDALSFVTMSLAMSVASLVFTIAQLPIFGLWGLPAAVFLMSYMILLLFPGSGGGRR